MDELWKILSNAHPETTLAQVWLNGQKELAKYKDFFHLTVEQMKMRIFMKDCSD